MADLINRQAAIDALEAKKDKSAKGDIGCFYNTIIQNAIDALNGLPSADVVQVVRCRKCKYFWTYRCMDSMPIETCQLAQTFYNPDIDFCSLAERREE